MSSVELARRQLSASASLLKASFLTPTRRRSSDYGLPPIACGELVCLLSTGDGSAVALSTVPGARGLVLLGSEGENSWLAPSVPAFLRNVKARRTGVPDVDRRERPHGLDRAKTKALRAFIAASAPRKPDTLDALARPLQRALVTFMRPRERGSLYWQQQWMVRLARGGVKITWYDGGEKPFAQSHGLHGLFEAVARRLPKKTEHRVTLDKTGTLFLDGHFEVRLSV